MSFNSLRRPKIRLGSGWRRK